MKSIRCGRGLGDSLYLQSVVRHLTRKPGDRLRVLSDYPAIFSQLGERRAVVAPFDRKCDIVAHYAPRKGVDGTTQFQDCCIAAGIRETIELRLDWQVQRPELVDRLRAPGRPILVVQLPRTPMGRTDGFGADLLPNCHLLQTLIHRFSGTHTVVQVGAGAPLHRFTGIDIDLANAGTVSDLLDVGATADRFLGYCSYMVPLAESFAKPALFVWANAGLTRGHQFIRRITPKKVLQLPSSRHVIDNWTEPQIERVLDDFMR
jgi:hypothetical protein